MGRFVSKGLWPWERALVLVASLACAWLTAERLHISGDLAALLPESGAAGALTTWTRAAGGRDPAVVLVRGGDPDDVASAASALAEALRHAPSLERVVERAPIADDLRDPTLAWIHAGPAARARLAEILTPEGMRARLRETRALLLAPGGDAEAEAWLARDPLRLAQVPWVEGGDLAAGVRAAPGGEFVADGGRARLVIAAPRGSAFESDAARSVVADVEAAMETARRAVPSVTMELSGGHAIALATEKMLKRDLALSGTLSLVLASAAFVVTFRRVRALLAVLPPLLLGTLWTTGIAALLPSGLRAVSVAFAAVVVGVGVDTGVHVYAAVLDARRQGHAGVDAARAARDATGRPTLLAAVVAAAAFGSLGLSRLSAMRELGLLCGAGEFLTAVAIVLVTPQIGAWLERKATPPPDVPPRWVAWIVSATSTKARALAALLACASPIAVLAVTGWPAPADALVAIRPRGLAPLVAAEHVRALFGGSPGQRIVLSIDADEDRARRRADRIAEALEPLEHDRAIEAFDSISTFSPASETLQARLAERARIELPSLRKELANALRDEGFDLDACAPALEAFAHPSAAPAPSEDDPALAWLRSRHVARAGGKTLVATFVRIDEGGGDADRLRAAILQADPGAVITGFDAIDLELRAALDHDLYLVGGAALVAVALGLRVALRSARHAIVALATLACEIGVVGVAMRALAVRWHVYDALVLPVLFGITIDESMFLLTAARGRSTADAMRDQAPLVASTALTTAAGFVALTVCRFSGLRDLGLVATIGVLAGLAAALVIVPSALKLASSN